MTAWFAPDHGIVRVETCTGTWLVDFHRSRYCRVARRTPATFVPPRSWHPFERLAVSPSGLVRLVLDRGGVTGITGWQHGDDCPRCDQRLRKPA
jgi:hypothetical protein